MVRVFKSKLLRVLVWSLAVGLTAWTFVHLPAATIIETIFSLSWPQWFAWFGINATIIALGTQRWLGLLTMLEAKINFSNLLFIRQAGQTINFITPGPQFGGEPLQVFWLCRNGLSLEKSLLSIGLDRFYELLINFTVLLICVFFLLFFCDVPFLKVTATVKKNLVGVTTLLAVATSILWLLIAHRAWISNRFSLLLTHWAERPLFKKIKHSWLTINRDLRFVLSTQKSTLINSAGISLLAWAALLGELALLLNFLNMDFNLMAFLLILIAMRLALLLPIPGGIGTLEASVFWSFQYLHFPGVAAVGLIALMRLRDIIILLFGLYCLHKVNGKSVAGEATPSY
jgi:uncharacterized protein (TIRG00374 family)